jgi:hypothetical protein
MRYWWYLVCSVHTSTNWGGMYYVNSLKQTTVQEKVYMSSCCSTQTHYICSYSLMICTFVVELQQSPILNYFAFKYIGFERTWWRLFIYWFWAYMMKVIHILVLSVHDEGYSYIGFERTWWRLFIYWFWAYMMKVIHTTDASYALNLLFEFLL